MHDVIKNSTIIDTKDPFADDASDAYVGGNSSKNLPSTTNKDASVPAVGSQPPEVLESLGLNNWPTLKLKPPHVTGTGEWAVDRNQHRKVPWINADQVEPENKRQLNGYSGIVKVENHEGKGFGLAVFNYRAGVCAKMVHHNALADIDTELFSSRIRKALLHRQRCFRGKEHYRVFNSDGDNVPGLVIDKSEKCFFLKL